MINQEFSEIIKKLQTYALSSISEFKDNKLEVHIKLKKNDTINAFLVKRFKKYFPDTSYGRWGVEPYLPAQKKAATKSDCHHKHNILG